MFVTGAAAATPKPGKVPAHIIFPVVGSVQYTDDFGAPRPGGPHQGNDLMAAKRSPAVATEAGKIKFWTTSATAGCMLYLYGDSGTTYLYIHLNNDLTRGNDNRGKCVAGTAYAKGLKNGARVAAGQQIGYVGDSGDANGIASHLHFEVHPHDGAAVDPFPYLKTAQHLLFCAKPGTPFALTLTGTVVSSGVDRIQLNVSTLQAWPMALRMTKLSQKVTLKVGAGTLVQAISRTGGTIPTSVALATKGQSVVVWTQPAPASLKAERGDDLSLAAALVQLTQP